MTCCGAPLGQDEADAVSRAMAEKLSGFVAILRNNAFRIGLAEAQDAAILLARSMADGPQAIREAWKALFSARKSDWDRFDGIFDAFWLGKRRRQRTANISQASGPANSPSLKNLDQSAAAGQAMATDQLPSPDQNDAGQGQGEMEGASRHDAIHDTDFRKFANPDDSAKAHAIAADLARAMRARLTRRDLPRAKGYRLDLRRTIHANIDRGGIPVDLVFRRRKPKPLRLVVMLDTSGSMSGYTGIFLRFIHGVLDEFREAEAFLFDTRLAHVSSAMRERDAARALDRLGLMAQSAGGGTRIGECLASFNRWHAARVIHSRTCVMIVSDGYDTGDADVLGREMQVLSRRCKRIVWLNPMLGWDGYQPEAAGMKAALPHVDLFARANTLTALAALEPYLARL